ncbi:EmrB/QacA subfamily drug resistance transporter [Actinocorallia herbida]|uniref:EmrB/QacA subfamily drug resistance transporter n=1 Tax=Actinocorallia herbida TaxID=58109 RepID=A0A3N1CUE0_9ACTN|nr:MFS transporter [Actinocorallia herbida]ROO84907.1 EmrB/QacA subfamily drug resistance transporter [Actinocorallia herbida]
MTSTAQPATADKRASVVLLVACLGQFLVVLDVSIVNVALPAIRTDLGFDATGLQWVVNAYALTFAGFLLLGGRAADLFGQKRVYLAGLALFCAASLAGGLADSAGLLVAARALQGVGAAVLSPATLTILATTFTDPSARTRAVARWSAAGAAAGAIGSVLGGVLTEYLSWRWVLLINVPVGGAVVAAAFVVLAERAVPTARRLDVTGAILVTAGFSLVAYGTAQTHEHGWGAVQALGPIGAGVAALALFLLVEARFATAPLVPLGIFKVRAISAASVIMVLVGAAFFAMWYFLSLYMQNVLHYSAIRAGLGFLPHTAAIIVGARSAPALMRRFGPRAVLILGAVLGTAGFLWQARLGEDTSYAAGLLGPAIVMCLGSGLLFTPVAALATGAAPGSEAGLVSGLINTARQVGGSIGLAALATVAASAAAPVVGYQHAFLAAAAALALIVPLSFALPKPAGP